MNVNNSPVPRSVIDAVEQYVCKDASTYEDSTLDEGGISALHRLASRIYAQGFDDGCQIEAERQRQVQLRIEETRSINPATEAVDTEVCPGFNNTSCSQGGGPHHN